MSLFNLNKERKLENEMTTPRKHGPDIAMVSRLRSLDPIVGKKNIILQDKRNCTPFTNRNILYVYNNTARFSMTVRY